MHSSDEVELLELSGPLDVRTTREVRSALHALLDVPGRTVVVDLCKVTSADVVASPTKVVQPDIFFVSRERLHLVDAYVDGGANFADWTVWTALETFLPETQDPDFRRSALASSFVTRSSSRRRSSSSFEE